MIEEEKEDNYLENLLDFIMNDLGAEGEEFRQQIDAMVFLLSQNPLSTDVIRKLFDVEDSWNRFQEIEDAEEEKKKLVGDIPKERLN